MDDPITAQIRQEVAAWEHRILPDSGWVSVVVHDAADLPTVIALFRLNDDRAWSRDAEDASAR